MSGQARRYLLVSLALLGLGVVLAGAPEPFLAAALQAPPSALEVCFACLMGLALLFKAGVCLTLRVRTTASDACQQHGCGGCRGALAKRALMRLTLHAACAQQATLRRRLHSTSSQRVMLGCVLPVISHCLSFKAVSGCVCFSQASWHLQLCRCAHAESPAICLCLLPAACPATCAPHQVLTEWGAAWSLPLLALYPAVLAAEFATHMAAFEVRRGGVHVRAWFDVRIEQVRRIEQVMVAGTKRLSGLCAVRVLQVLNPQFTIKLLWSALLTLTAADCASLHASLCLCPSRP